MSRKLVICRAAGWLFRGRSDPMQKRDENATSCRVCTSEGGSINDELRLRPPAFNPLAGCRELY